MAGRLETVSSDLAAQMQRASAAKQHAACVVACELALTKVDINDGLVLGALRKLQGGGSLTAAELTGIEALCNRLDERYFALQEEAESGVAGPADYLRVFAQARAVAAVQFAAMGHCADALYEAITAMGDDKEELERLVRSMLG